MNSLVTMALATILATSTADPALTQTVDPNENIAPAGTQVEIDQHHADLGPRLIDGKWEFMVRDDSAETPVWRHLDDVVFRVHDAGKMDVPDSADYEFVGAAGQAWVVPQQEIPGVLWLGWSTQDPNVVNSVNGQVEMIYGGHTGPGRFTAFVQAGNFSGPERLWTSEQDTSQPVHVDLNTHTHANWVFTEPGAHLLRMTASATLTDGSVVEDTHELRFAVGDAVSDDEVRQLAATVTGADASKGSAGNGASSSSKASGEGTTNNSSAAGGSGDKASAARDEVPGSSDSADSASRVWLVVGLGAVIIVVVGVLLCATSRRRRASQRAALAAHTRDSAGGNPANANATGANTNGRDSDTDTREHHTSDARAETNTATRGSGANPAGTNPTSGTESDPS